MFQQLSMNTTDTEVIANSLQQENKINNNIIEYVMNI